MDSDLMRLSLLKFVIIQSSKQKKIACLKGKKEKDNIHENNENVYSHWIFITSRSTSLLQWSTKYYATDRYKSCLHPKEAEAIRAIYIEIK